MGTGLDFSKGDEEESQEKDDLAGGDLVGFSDVRTLPLVLDLGGERLRGASVVPCFLTSSFLFREGMVICVGGEFLPVFP